MATITTRSGKGSPLTNTELDANFTNLNTDKVEKSGDSMTGNLTFGDNDKAIFGAGSDLQIYHDGSNSYIDDAGTGNLYLRATNAVIIQSADGLETLASFHDDNLCRLYYDNAEKLATTSTGIDVTGTVVSDGLTVDTASPTLFFKPTADTQTGYITFNNTAGSARGFMKYDYSSDTMSWRTGGVSNRMSIGSGGDISFYEDTGTTPKFFWDASAERLGIGTSSPVGKLDVRGGNAYIDGGGSGGASQVILSTSASSGANFGQLTNTGTRWSLGYSASSTAIGTEVLTWNSSGNVGIGTSSPTAELHIKGAQPADAFDSQLLVDTTDTTGTIDYGSKISFGYHDGVYGRTGPYILGAKENNTYGNYASYMSFATRSNGGSPTERMRIDSSGVVNIKNTGSTADFISETATSFIVGDGSGTQAMTVYSGTANNGALYFADGSTGNATYRGGVQYLHGSDAMRFLTSATERMRLDSSGNLLIGTTTTSVSSAGWDIFSDVSNTAPRANIRKTYSGTATAFAFYHSGSVVGSITYSNTATAYNTSSDYRLKENVVDLTGAIDRVKQLKVHQFNFIGEPDQTVDGFLAHEAQEVVPEAVTGTKDAVDADGNPEYQGIDQSKLTPLLTAALQEAIARIESLEAEVAALKA